MITITYSKEYIPEERVIRYEITANGHAEHSKDGDPDIVCAAVSQTLYTLASYLEEIGANQDTRDEPDFVLRCDSPLHDDRIYTAMGMTMTGLYLTAEQYPDNVEIEDVER